MNKYTAQALAYNNGYELGKKVKQEKYAEQFIKGFNEALKVADLNVPKKRIFIPTVNVGQTVYVIDGDEESDWIDEYEVKYFYCSSKGINRYYIKCGTMGNNFRPKDIGKTVFLTKAEAEKALKEHER